METQENDSVVVEAEPSTSHAPDGDDPLRQSSEVLARGLSSMLSSVITDFDCRANQTLRSQDHLSSVLDRLTGGLSLFLHLFLTTLCQVFNCYLLLRTIQFISSALQVVFTFTLLLLLLWICVELVENWI